MFDHVSEADLGGEHIGNEMGDATGVSRDKELGLTISSNLNPPNSE